MLYFQNQIKEAINRNYKNLEVVFTSPPDTEMGHLSIPCFNFAKVLKKSPKDIGAEISVIIKDLFFIDKVELTGGYLNLSIKKHYVEIM